MQKLYNLLYNPLEAEKNPLGILLLGFFYATLSIFVSIWLFPDHASIVMIFLTTIACLSIFQRALVLQEKKERDSVSETLILKEHTKVIQVFFFIFVGFLASFILWSAVLPENLSAMAFSFQSDTVDRIRSITGNAGSPENPFPVILFNNSKVLILSVLFAIFYGAGALFILAWNASIMGFVIGNVARTSLGYAGIPIAFTKYFSHGIIEMVAYFIGALAGGILFIAILKRDFRQNKMKRLMIDALILILVSFTLIVIGALVETFITAKI